MDIVKTATYLLQHAKYSKWDEFRKDYPDKIVIENAEFVDMTWKDLVLTDIHFLDCAFTRGYWQGCELTKCLFTSSEFQNIDLLDCRFTLCELDHTLWQEMEFDKIALKDVSWTSATFNVAYFLSPYMYTNVDFTDSRFFDTYFFDLHDVKNAIWPKTDMVFSHYKESELSVHVQHDWVQVGCQRHTVDAWLAMTEEQFDNQIGRSDQELTYFRTWREELAALARLLPPYERKENEHG